MERHCHIGSCHYSCGGGTGKFEPWSGNWIFGIVLRQFVNFAVPVFLGLAGFFAVRGAKGESTVRYCAKRFSRIVPAYLAWTLVFVALTRPGHFFSLSAISRDIFLGEGIAVGYFVIVLLQYTLLTPILLRIRSEFIHFVLIFCGFFVSCGFAYAVRILGYWGEVSEFPLYAVPFFAWGPFYHVGLYLAMRREGGGRGSTLPVRDSPSWLILFFPLLASICESLYWADIGEYAFGASQIKASTFVMSLMILVKILGCADSRPAGRMRSVVERLGRISYPVYLIHFPVLVACQRLLGGLPQLYEAQPLYVLTLVAIVLLLCVSAISVLQIAQNFRGLRWSSVFLGEAR